VPDGKRVVVAEGYIYLCGCESQRHRLADVDGGVITAGQVIGLIDDIPTCAVLIERIVAECRERLGASMKDFE
jgi:NAD(P)H-dependent flavin oxidoreductase YrpB (nitropropane dioxygenase family)